MSVKIFSPSCHIKLQISTAVLNLASSYGQSRQINSARRPFVPVHLLNDLRSYLEGRISFNLKWP